MPALQYVYDNFPHIVMHIWAQPFAVEIFKRSLPVDKKRIIIRDIQKDFKKYNNNLPGRGFAFSAYTNLASHMTKHAFHQLVNLDPKPEDMNYLPIRVDDINITKFNLPAKYVVLPLGFTSQVREFLPQNVNPIIDYIKSKGYEVVFLGDGKKETEQDIGAFFRQEIDWHKGINLIGQTCLLEAAKILYGAKCAVGVDNGLLHLASTHPELPVVGGFTTVHSDARLPYRHGIKGYNWYAIDIPKEKLGCINCQSRLVLTFNHDFKQCFENVNAHGSQIKCLEMMKSELFITELEKIL